MTLQAISYTRPWLYPKQEAAIFCKERYGIVEASTKSGKTKRCVAWLIEQALKAKARARRVFMRSPGQSALAPPLGSGRRGA